MLIRGHIAGYGDISFTVQHLPPLCNQPCLLGPFTWWVFPATWDELDECTSAFPKPGHWPIIWPIFEHHFDTIGTCEIMQCRKMGSQDKISSSVPSFPAYKEKMGHRSGQIHALARPALAWGCLRLPWLHRGHSSASASSWCTSWPARNTAMIDIQMCHLQQELYMLL